MTTDDLRTRAKKAAEGRYSGPQWHVGTIRERQVEAYVEGYLAHAAQQPTREQIARAIADSDDQPDLTDEQAVHHYGHAADAVLALLDGAGS